MGRGRKGEKRGGSSNNKKMTEKDASQDDFEDTKIASKNPWQQ